VVAKYGDLGLIEGDISLDFGAHCAKEVEDMLKLSATEI